MRRILFLLILLIAFPILCRAEGLVLRRHVFGAAGGRVIGTTHKAGFTAGGEIIGVSQTDSIWAAFGFWGGRGVGNITSVDPRKSAMPEGMLVLYQNYPNPFASGTSISYAVGGNEALTVNLAIYDAMGRLVRTLVNETKNPGVHNVTWNGRNERGRQVTSAVYFYRIEAGGHTKTRKLLLLK